MLYHIEMIQKWCGDIIAENEDDALETADMFFSQQEVNTSVIMLKEKEKIKMAYTHECPVNDQLCSYFDNGNCNLEDPEFECDAFFIDFDEEEEDD